MKKAGHSTSKSGTGHIGKGGTKIKPSGGSMGSGGKIGLTGGKAGSSSGKIGSNGGQIVSSPKISSFPPVSQKSYASPSFNTSRSGKSSTSFGIIWLPMKKRNKYKDVSFNSNNNERPVEKRPSMYGFMSGDSNHPPLLDHKKEEASLLVPENKASTSVAIIGAGAVTASDLTTDKPTRTEEKQDLIKHEDESKDASGDVDKISDDYLENNEKVISNALDQKKDKAVDNVDSVFLRPPPPHKRHTAPPAADEEEDCGIKCLYYTLQCCDCVLM